MRFLYGVTIEQQREGQGLALAQSYRNMVEGSSNDLVYYGRPIRGRYQHARATGCSAFSLIIIVMFQDAVGRRDADSG